MPDGVHIAQSSKRAQPLDPFGTSIDQSALFARKWGLFVVALEEILPDLRAKMFKEKPEPCRYWVVLEHGAFGLKEVIKTDRGSQTCNATEQTAPDGEVEDQCNPTWDE